MEYGRLLIVNENEVKSILTMPRVLDLMEHVFVEYGKGRVVNPVKLHLSLRPHIDGYLNSMPAYLIDSDIMGVKLAGCWKMNTAKDLPTTIGVIVLFFPENGVPYAIVDGTFVTAIRTGAIVGLQAKYLAKKNSRVATIIGAGAQGYSSMQSLQVALDGLHEVRLVDINPIMIERYLIKAKTEFPDTQYIVINDIQSAVANAHVVVSCANAGKPLLQGINFDKGTHVISVSERIQSTQWLEDTFDLVVTDFPECFVTRENQENLWAAQQTGTKPIELDAEIFDTTLDKIVVKEARGRTTDDQLVFSATVGMGMEDVIVAQDAYLAAAKKGLGVIVDFMDLQNFK
ncbi:MAG: ornithine cyclodeaminase family protein [Acetomicrobium sp.]|jgi:ornithine cyclodeaminase/alanine dehydrogenase-like protein (mu-crystallin family)